MLNIQLRNQIHSNFIRWSICNENKSRTIFFRSFAITNIIIDFIIIIVLILFFQSRYWRIFAILKWWFDIINFIVVYKNLYVFLHKLHIRNIKFWKSIDDNHRSKHFQNDEKINFENKILKYENTTSNWSMKMKMFEIVNNYNDESCIEKKKFLWKRIFDRKITIQFDNFSIIQNRIIKQTKIWIFIIIHRSLWISWHYQKKIFIESIRFDHKKNEKNKLKIIT